MRSDVVVDLLVKLALCGWGMAALLWVALQDWE